MLEPFSCTGSKPSIFDWVCMWGMLEFKYYFVPVWSVQAFSISGNPTHHLPHLFWGVSWFIINLFLTVSPCGFWYIIFWEYKSLYFHFSKCSDLVSVSSYLSRLTVIKDHKWPFLWILYKAMNSYDICVYWVLRERIDHICFPLVNFICSILVVLLFFWDKLDCCHLISSFCM